jgi:hypothetical protein
MIYHDLKQRKKYESMWHINHDCVSVLLKNIRQMAHISFILGDSKISLYYSEK